MNYAEKQEFILKNKIEALEEILPKLKNSISYFPDTIWERIEQTIREKKENLKSELENIYKQNEIF